MGDRVESPKGGLMTAKDDAVRCGQEALASVRKQIADILPEKTRIEDLSSGIGQVAEQQIRDLVASLTSADMTGNQAAALDRMFGIGVAAHIARSQRQIEETESHLDRLKADPRLPTIGALVAEARVAEHRAFRAYDLAKKERIRLVLSGAFHAFVRASAFTLPDRSSLWDRLCAWLPFGRWRDRRLAEKNQRVLEASARQVESDLGIVCDDALLGRYRELPRIESTLESHYRAAAAERASLQSLMETYEAAAAAHRDARANASDRLRSFVLVQLFSLPAHGWAASYERIGPSEKRRVADIIVLREKTGALSKIRDFLAAHLRIRERCARRIEDAVSGWGSAGTESLAVDRDRMEGLRRAVDGLRAAADAFLGCAVAYADAISGFVGVEEFERRFAAKRDTKLLDLVAETDECKRRERLPFLVIVSGLVSGGSPQDPYVTDLSSIGRLVSLPISEGRDRHDSDNPALSEHGIIPYDPHQQDPILRFLRPEDARD